MKINEHNIAPGADLRGADLRGANLRYADLRDANLRGADLRGANLAVVRIDRADLRDTMLDGADLTEARAVLADLRNADMRHAILRFTDLRGADLRRSDMRHAIIGGSKHEAGFVGARLDGADLRDIQSIDDYGIVFDHAILRGADLRGLDLRMVDMFCADITGARLDGALLTAGQLDWVIDGRQKVQVPSRHSLSVAPKDKMETNILLSCSGEYLGEVSSMSTHLDHGHVPGPDGYVMVREPSLSYSDIKITPRDGGQQDVLDTLKGFVRDKMPRDYEFLSNGDIHTIHGRLTCASIGDDGIITVSIDARRRPSDC